MTESVLERLPSFLQLSRNCKKDAELKCAQRLAVLGDCSTQHLTKAIRGYAVETGVRYEMMDADYDQIALQVSNPASELYAFQPDSILLFMCTEKLYEKYCGTSLDQRTAFAEQTMNTIAMYWEMIGSNCRANLLFFTFLEYEDHVFGNYGLRVESSFSFQIRKLNYLLLEAAAAHKSVFLINLNHYCAQVGSSVFTDRKMYYAAKMAVTTAAMPLVAKAVVDMISAISGKIKKCTILDLDNTLWGGVIGDDGMNGIEIGELGSGHAFSALQQWLKELRNRGIILCVCSKNNEDTAKEPFLKHPEMVLRLEDIALFVANWNDKATNIRYIQKTLNIGMDSIVFLDDNVFERNLVRQMIPELTVPELPEDPAEYVPYLQELNLFETASYSSEDANRTSQYQAEVNRAELEAQFASFDDYLRDLQMRAEAKPFDEFHFPRIAQLTQRSNQFNLRTVRYTEEQIRAIAQDPQHLTMYFTLRDRFGDHGLISVVILDKMSDSELFVSEWLMSCRVLKRGMEEYIVNKIASTARENGFQTIRAEYIPTAKNKMVANLYEEMGFTREDDQHFHLAVSDFEERKTFIQPLNE